MGMRHVCDDFGWIGVIASNWVDLLSNAPKNKR